MADYYTLFSWKIEETRSQAFTWARRSLTARQVNDDIAYEMEKDGIWLYSDENERSDPEAAAAFIQAFLAKWQPEQEFVGTYAYTCNRPLIDAFGGGWVKVTRDHSLIGDARPPAVKIVVAGGCVVEVEGVEEYELVDLDVMEIGEGC